MAFTQLSKPIWVMSILLLAFWLSILIRRAFSTSLRYVPGPWYASVTNLVLKAKVMQGQRSQYIHALHQKFGRFVRISPDEISVSELSAVKIVHRAGSPYVKSIWYQKLKPSPYPGVFTMIDPKQHAARKRLFAQSFSNSSMLHFEPIVREKVETAVTKIRRDALAGNADILKWFTFMATDAIGELSFGTSFAMLDKEEKSPYIRDLEMAFMISGISVELGFLLKLAAMLPIESVQRMLNLVPRVDEYGTKAIENLQEYNANAGDGGRQTLFSRFTDSSKNHELPLPAIGTEAGNFIVAGSDTTAVSLTYLVWAVLKPQHRDIKEKLLQEISSLPSSADMKEVSTLKYLRAVIDEALRLYGAAPGSLPRVVPPEGSQLGPYLVPGGTTVSVQAYTLHRDESIFADAESFRPERWENPTQEMKDAYMPFGLGSRTCLGIHLAMMEMLLGAFVFFKTCPTAVLAMTTTEDSMEFENYFVIAPKSHKCEITL